MAELDHMILNVADPAASLRFYQEVLEFRPEGRTGPFHVLRVNPGLTLDLLDAPPAQRLHLAFRVDAARFERIVARLRERDIPFGGQHADRSGSPPQPAQGAFGLAASCYFEDPDGHYLEIRLPPT